MTILQENIYSDIQKERLRQLCKWGEQNHSPELWIIILGEEFGEVCKAKFEGNKNEYRKELVHVAAVAVAAIESFDRNL